MWKDWLAFSRKEQYGIIVLSILLFALVVARLILSLFWEPPAFNPIENVADFIEKQNGVNNRWKTEKSTKDEESSYQFRFFNPNEVTVTELDRMGLPNNVIINWMKYLENGGVFDQPHEIAKIYGLDSLLARQLSQYAIISERSENAKNIDILPHQKDSTQGLFAFRNLPNDFDVVRSRRKTYNVDTFFIDLNKATPSELKKLKGIGDVLSQRIVKYRDLLGGFYCSEQLLEVYGISSELYDEIYQYLFVDEEPYRKISINKSSVRFLKSHPYLNFYQARDIFEYRRKIGNIHSVQELKQIPSLDDQTLKKLIPYIDFETEQQKIGN